MQRQQNIAIFQTIDEEAYELLNVPTIVVQFKTLMHLGDSKFLDLIL